MTTTPPQLDAQGLLLELGQRTAKVCSCTVGACPSWESVPGDRWPAAQMHPLGSLRQPLSAVTVEPTYEEYHPRGTRYESPLAPVAPLYFPYNRCDVFVCQTCQCVLLKYTEFGGYYVDQRVRLVQADQVVDADLPNAQST